MDASALVKRIVTSEPAKAFGYAVLGGLGYHFGKKLLSPSKPKQTTKKRKSRSSKSVAKVVKVAKKAIRSSGNRKAKTKRGRPRTAAVAE